MKVDVTAEGAEVLSEPVVHRLGTLSGWGPVRGSRPSFSSSSEGAPIEKVSWILRGETGEQVTVRIRSERGGRHEIQLRLGAK